MLEPDLEPKALDVWSQNLKFEFRLRSPALGYCSLRYGKCIS